MPSFNAQGPGRHASADIASRGHMQPSEKLSSWILHVSIGMQE